MDRDERGGLVDDGADGCLFDADDAVVGDQGAEPVKEVQDFGAGDSGEEVLVAPRKADDLVRERGAADEEQVVVENGAVDVDRDAFSHQTRRNLGGFRFVEPPEPMQGGRVIPFMVE